MFPLGRRRQGTSSAGRRSSTGQRRGLSLGRRAGDGRGAGSPWSAGVRSRWPRRLAPAIARAEEGIPVTWHTTLTIAGGSRHPEAVSRHGGDLSSSRRQSADDRRATRPRWLRQEDLARTLHHRREGPRAFYEGPLDRLIVVHLAGEWRPSPAGTSPGTRRRSRALSTDLPGPKVHTIGGKAPAAPSLVEALNLLPRLDPHLPPFPPRPCTAGPGIPDGVRRPIRLPRRSRRRRGFRSTFYRSRLPRSGCARRHVSSRSATSRERTGIRHGLRLDPGLRRRQRSGEHGRRPRPISA